MPEQWEAQSLVPEVAVTLCLQKGVILVILGPWAAVQASEMCLMKWIRISYEKILKVSWTLCEKLYFNSEHQNILEEIKYIPYNYLYI